MRMRYSSRMLVEKRWCRGREDGGTVFENSQDLQIVDLGLLLHDLLMGNAAGGAIH